MKTYTDLKADADDLTVCGGMGLEPWIAQVRAKSPFKPVFPISTYVGTGCCCSLFSIST